MKKLIVAAGLTALMATAASAQVPAWERSRYPYEQRHHAVCQAKAHQLYDYERRAASDGRISRRERETIAALQRELDATCGRYRWRG